MISLHWIGFFPFMESFWSKNNKKQTNTLPLVIKFESNIITIINSLREKLDKSVVKISLSLLFLYLINEPNGFQFKNSDWYINVSRCVCDCLPSYRRVIKYFSFHVDCLTLSIHRSSSIFVGADKWSYYIIFIHLRNFENIVLQANKSTHYQLRRENFTFQFKVHTKLWKSCCSQNL